MEAGNEFTKSTEKNKPPLDDIKLFTKNEKELGDPDTNNKNIQEWNLALKNEPCW